MLGLSIITASVVYIDSQSTNLFITEYGNENVNNFTYVRYNLNSIDNNGQYIDYNSNFLNFIKEKNDNINASGYSGHMYYNSPIISYNRMGVLVRNQTIINIPVIKQTNNPNIFNELSQISIIQLNPVFDQFLKNKGLDNASDYLKSYNDSILLTPYNNTKQLENNLLYLQSEVFVNNSFISPMNLTISKSLELQTNSGFVEKPFSYLDSFSLVLFVSSIRQIFMNFDIGNNTKAFSNYNPVNYGLLINYSLSNMNFDNIIKFNNYNKESLDNFQQSMNAIILKHQNIYDPGVVYITYDFHDELSNIISNVNSQSITIIATSFPLIILSFFITNYFFKSFETYSLKLASKFKRKGIKSSQFAFIYLIQIIPIVILAVFFAIPFGLLLTVFGLVIQPYFILNFNNIPQIIINYEKIISYLLLFSFLYIYINYIPKVYSYLKSNSHPDNLNIMDSEGFWKKHYLDIWMIGVALGELFLVSTLSFLLKPSELSLAQGISTPFPLILVIGLLLLSMRLIPIIINKVGSILWVKKTNILAIGFKQIYGLKATFNRSLIILTILTILFTSYIAYPYTNNQLIIQNDINNFSFDVNFRADLTFYSSQIPINQRIQSYNRFVSSVLSNYSSDLQYSEGTWYTINTLTNFGGQTGLQRLLALNLSTNIKMFEKYVPDKKLELSRPLDQDLKDLQSDTGVPGILLDKQSLEYYNFHVGEIVTFRSPNNNENTTQLKIIDSFNYWPGFVYYTKNPGQFYGILDQNIYSKYASNFTHVSFFKEAIVGHFNFNNGISYEQQNKTMTKIEQSNQNNLLVTNMYINTLSYPILHSQNDLSNLLLWSSVGLIIGLLAIYCILISVSFTIKIIELLKRDAAIFKTLGLSNFQQLQLSLLFIVLFTTGSIVFGFLLGIIAFYLEQWIYNFTQPSQIIVIMPFQVIIPLFIAIIIVSTIICFIYVYFNKKVNLTILNNR